MLPTGRGSCTPGTGTVGRRLSTLVEFQDRQRGRVSVRREGGVGWRGLVVDTPFNRDKKVRGRRLKWSGRLETTPLSHNRGGGGRDRPKIRKRLDNQFQPQVGGVRCRELPFTGQEGGCSPGDKQGLEPMICSTGPSINIGSDTGSSMNVQPTVPAPALAGSWQGGSWEQGDAGSGGGVVWREGLVGGEKQYLAGQEGGVCGAPSRHIWGVQGTRGSTMGVRGEAVPGASGSQAMWPQGMGSQATPGVGGTWGWSLGSPATGPSIMPTPPLSHHSLRGQWSPPALSPLGNSVKCHNCLSWGQPVCQAV